MVGSVIGNDKIEFIMYPDQGENTEEGHHLPMEPHEHEEMETSDQPTRNEKELDQRLLIPKTKPEPCDNEMFLYTLVHYTDKNISSSGYNKTMTDCSR